MCWDDSYWDHRSGGNTRNLLFWVRVPRLIEQVERKKGVNVAFLSLQSTGRCPCHGKGLELDDPWGLSQPRLYIVGLLGCPAWGQELGSMILVG